MIRYPTRAALAAAKTVLYGGTYRYQNTDASKLALVDPALRLYTLFGLVAVAFEAADRALKSVCSSLPPNGGPMRIQVAIEADNMAQMEIAGTEEGVHLTQPFEGKWSTAGLLRLSAALKGAALTMLAEAKAPAAAMVAPRREISGSWRPLSCL